MATIAAQEIDLNGVDPSMTAADPLGDAFANPSERTLFKVINGAGAPRTITLSAQTPCNQGYTHDIVLVTADGDDITVGPFDRERFNDSAGLIQVSYDDESNVTIAALTVSKPPTR
jgi:hypothetical protein